jgi:hypothetical protein
VSGKSLLGLRNVMDVFAAAYFPQTVDGQRVDVWRMIRADIADGYVTIGVFQDLSHSGAQYTQQDLQTRREAVLAWKAAHDELAKRVKMAEYLSSPSEKDLYVVPATKRHQSTFFWRFCKHQPSPRLTGMENVQLLVNQLLDSYSERAPRILALHSILPFEVHEEFHNFRKSARAILSIRAMLPQLFADGAQPELDTLQTFYKKMGDENDTWSKYWFYKTDKLWQTAAAAAAAAGAPNAPPANRDLLIKQSTDQCEQGWKELKKWLVDTDPQKVAHRLKRHVHA